MKTSVLPLVILMALIFSAALDDHGNQMMGMGPGGLRRPAEMLRAKDAAVREQGRQEILTARTELVTELSQIVREFSNHATGEKCPAHDAMRLLGDLRASEGIDVLVERIGFPFVRYPEAVDGPEPGGIIQLNTPGHYLQDYLPAINALRSIGKACIFPVAKKWALSSSRIERNACEAVLCGLDNAPGIQMDGALDWAYWHATSDGRRDEMQWTRRKLGLPSTPVLSK
jgi:hypothetical protein